MLLKETNQSHDIEDVVSIIYEKLYKDCIEEFDAVDNGISPYPSDVVPAFKSGSTSVFARVNILNPSWNHPRKDDGGFMMEQFEQAVSITGDIFQNTIRDLMIDWWPARDIVHRAYQELNETHKSGQILLLEPNCPWKDHLFDIEAEHPKESPALYVIYEDKIHDKWMAQAVPIHASSFTSKRAFPEPWRGLRDDKLDHVTRIPGGVFVHATGFIAGHSTKEGITRLCELALQYTQ